MAASLPAVHGGQTSVIGAPANMATISIHINQNNVKSISPCLSPHYRFTGSPDDLGAYALPGLVEEEDPESNLSSCAPEPRARSGSIKAFFTFKKSTKKTDTKAHRNCNNSPPQFSSSVLHDNDNYCHRARSQSDAGHLRHNMRRRHISGSNQPLQSETNSVALHPVSLDAPEFRGRSTSWGSKPSDLLRRGSLKGDSAGGQTQNGSTIMSQLISGTGRDPNGRRFSLAEQANSAQRIGVHCLGMKTIQRLTNDSPFTGKAYIWHKSIAHDDRNKQWNSAVDDCSNGLGEMEIEDLEINDPRLYAKFMRAHKCYDLVPTSAKLIVFDTQLNVKKAFYALVYNQVRAAPLWDHEKQTFIGMLTISDFISILTECYRSPHSDMHELEEHKISTWRQVLASKYKPFVSIAPDVSLYEAVTLLLDAKVHRLPIVDPETGNALYILTHKRVLRFLSLFMKDIQKPGFMYESIADLKIGTYQNLFTVSYDTPLIEALTTFQRRSVSALPVVDEKQNVLNIYSKFDVINLAAEQMFHDLSVPLSQVISRLNRSGHVHSCLKTESLNVVVERIVKAEVHRLMIVDEDNKLTGMVSLSDILRFLIRGEFWQGLQLKTSCAVSTDETMDTVFNEPLEAM